MTLSPGEPNEPGAQWQPGQPQGSAPWTPTGQFQYGTPVPINGPGYPPPSNYPTPPVQPPAPPGKKRNTKLIVAGIVGAVLVLCCGGATIIAATSDNKPKTTAANTSNTKTQAAAAAGLPVFNTPTQVIDYLAKNGLACGTESPVANPASGAFTMSQCGGQVVISSYANPGAAAASRDTLSAVMKDSGFKGYAVTFGNWLINAGSDQAYAQKVADLFHGTVTPIGGEKPSPTPPPSPTGPTLTASQQQAVGAAQDYLKFMHFSRSGLIGQLKHDGFSTADATVGVDNAGADWTAQADGAAADYLKLMHFSRSGLISQLEHDGFTPDQAKHGATSAGL